MHWPGLSACKGIWGAKTCQPTASKKNSILAEVVDVRSIWAGDMPAGCGDNLNLAMRDYTYAYTYVYMYAHVG